MTEHTPLPAFAAYSGPRSARCVLVGEAWGGNEADLRRPFVGEAGKEAFRMLGEAMPLVAPDLHAEITGLFKYGLAWSRRRDEWLEAAGIGMTNVLALRPPENKLEALCTGKAEAGSGYDWPSITHGKYLRAEFLPEVHRLYEELSTTRPNLVVAFGNTACWALLRATNIGSIRGNVTTGAGQFARIKVLPTFHPAAVLRMWSWRPIVVADLMKAGREMAWPEVRRPQRTVIVNPSLDEIKAWVDDTVIPGRDKWPLLSVDIETGAGQIKCVGFARSRSEALVIPFIDPALPEWSYWPTAADEWQAWNCVRILLECQIPKLFQNGMYDLQYLTRMGFRPVNCDEDTMLLHHSLFPELQKGLGFLGSIYTSESSWKLMRRRRPDTEKRDD